MVDHPPRVVLRMILMAVLLTMSVLIGRPEPAAAAGPCYWYSYSRTNVLWANPFSKITSSVNYQVGFTCERRAILTKVTYSKYTIQTTDTPGYAVETRISGHHIFQNDQTGASYSYPNNACNNVCTVSSTRYPNVTMPYSTQNAAYLGCGPCGTLATVQVWHYFQTGQMRGTGATGSD